MKYIILTLLTLVLLCNISVGANKWSSLIAVQGANAILKAKSVNKPTPTPEPPIPVPVPTNTVPVPTN